MLYRAIGLLATKISPKSPAERGQESREKKEEAEQQQQLVKDQSQPLLKETLGQSKLVQEQATAGTSDTQQGSGQPKQVQVTEQASVGLGKQAMEVQVQEPQSQDSSSSSAIMAEGLSLAQLEEGLRQLLSRNSVLHNMMAALIVSFWGQCPSSVMQQLQAALTEQNVCEEIVPLMLSMQRECQVRHYMHMYMYMYVHMPHVRTPLK